MKVKAMFLFMVVAAILASCTNEENPVGKTAGRSNLTLNIKGEKQSSSSRATGLPSDADQSEINDFIIFTFKADGTNDVDPKELTTMPSGNKVNMEISTDANEVYVIANTKSNTAMNVELLNVKSKSDLQKVVGRAFDDDTQTASPTQTYNNLWMSGKNDANFTPTENGNVNVAVTLKYIAATIRITSVTVDASLTNLTLQSVAILNAGAATRLIPADKAISLIPTFTPTTQTPFYVHGIENTFSNKPQVSGLNNEYLYTLTGTPAQIGNGENEHYFYVFENDGVAFESQPTILTLKGSVDVGGGVLEDAYYSVFFKKNAPTENSYDDEIIERGKRYDVTMNIKKAGPIDPTIPARKTTVDVTITPATWETVSINKDYE